MTEPVFARWLHVERSQVQAGFAPMRDDDADVFDIDLTYDACHSVVGVG